MTQTVENILKINVSHSSAGGKTGESATVATTPGTGTGGITDRLGTTNSLAIGAFLITLIIAIIVFCTRKRLFCAQKAKNISSLALILISGVTVSASIGAGANAKAITPIETTISIITKPETNTVAENYQEIRLGKTYEHGYKVYAFLDDAIYKSDFSAKIEGTKNASSKDSELLTSNTYGVKSQASNTYRTLPSSEEGAIEPIFETKEPSNSFTIGYAVKLDNSTIPEGAYSGKITYIIKENIEEYKIILDNASADTAGSTEIYETYSKKFALTSGGEAMTTTENPIILPEKSNSFFSGYYTEANGAGTQYINAEGYLTSKANSTHFTNDGKLYAKWDNFFSIKTMQEMTPEICATATTPSPEASSIDIDGTHRGDINYIPTKTLKDTRDNKEYTVEKLADGKCWMVNQDLDLELKTTKTLTSTDTDLNTVSEWTPTASTKTYWHKWTKGVANSRKISTSKMGVHYTLLAAAAADNNEQVFDPSGKMNNTICPKGWTIPESYSTFTDTYNIITGEQVTLAEYNRLVADSTPWHFQELAFIDDYGYYNDGYETAQNYSWLQTGWYWTSTLDYRSGENGNAYGFMFGNNDRFVPRFISSSQHLDQDYAYVIRCVAR